MPIYEYVCESHGSFEALKSIQQASLPEPCPTCDAPGARILSAPNLACMPRAARIAQERNERSSHEPRRGNKAAAKGHDHHGHTHKKAKPGSMHAYTGKRPWVIEHG